MRQLRYFVTVVEEANFTRAAARLHLAQPGLSAQIRKLERELGQPLLERGTRAVTLTAVGAAVLPHARAALAATDRITDTVADLTGLLRGRVRFGAVSGTAGEGFDIAGALADFHDAHPGVTISLTEHTSDDMLAAVRRGDLELALVGLDGAELDPGIAVHVVLETPIAAAVARDSAAPRDRIPLSELAGQRLITLPPGTGIRGVLDRTCAAAGFEPDIAYEAAAPPLLFQLAARGLGVAVVPAVSPGQAAEFGVRTLRITDPEPRARLALVHRRDKGGNPATAALLERLLRAFGAA